MSNTTLPVLVGGGAFAAWAFMRRGRRTLPDAPPAGVPDVASSSSGASPPTKTATASPIVGPLPGRWVWPVPLWRGRRPVISDGWGSPRPNGQHHEGVDLMFARDAADPWRSGTPNGAAHHVMPDDMVAVATADGVVWSAGWTTRGFTIVVDHTPAAPVATYYTHLALLLVAPTARAKSGQRVRAGQPIGMIGHDPQDPAHLRHLHFALWRGGPSEAVDPAPLMRGWEYVGDPREPAPPVTGARNASFTYRPVGERGDDYPEWVRSLRGKSGVYVIRERAPPDDDPQIVYVGESHTGRLYETLTRHFQEWRRWKSWWKGQYAEGHDPGLTYARDRVEVAVRITSPNRAIDEEARLIRRLKPRDNLLGQPVEAEVPF